MPESSGRRVIRVPLRLRFALLSTGIVALALTVVFVVVMLFQNQYVRGRFDARLEEGSLRVARELSPEALAIADGFGVRTDVDFDELVRGDLGVAVFSPRGALLATDRLELASELSTQLAERLPALTEGVEYLNGRITRGNAGVTPHYRIALRRTQQGYGIAVFGSLGPIEQATRTAITVFMIKLPIIFVVIGVAGWYVAGLVLRPIEEMRSIVRKLAPNSIPGQVDLRPTSPEVQRLESELEEAMARIEAGYETQSRFMSNVAHELKTPISVILAQGQTLSDRSEMDDESRVFIESTVEEMRRLGRLVESFLMLTRVREGKEAHLKSMVSVNELLMESVSHCLVMAREYGVELTPTLVESEPEAMVSGDADLLRTAIDNLIRNAIRFSKRGDQIEITAWEAGDDWAVDVRDHGPGIPVDLIDRVFDRFAQSSEERRRGRGSGLGLEIAQGIVELHGGGITVTNEDPGCRFVVRLPKGVPAT